MNNNVQGLRNQSALNSSTEIAHFMSRVYGWMTLGLAMSGLVAWQLSLNPELMISILQNPLSMIGLFLLQIGAVITLTAAIQKLSPTVAGLIYFTYAALTGVTLSFVFLAYAHDSVVSTFVLTSFAFAGLSGFGYVTKRDLGPVGSFCMMGLFGMIGWSLISFFVPSLMAGMGNTLYGVMGLIVFAGLTAYDTQKVKAYYTAGDRGTIVGALTLYLDFINLFLSLLRIFGRRR